MDSLSHINLRMAQMLRIEKKDSNQLSTVKRLFERVKEEDWTLKFQDVPIKIFFASNESCQEQCMGGSNEKSCYSLPIECWNCTWKVLNYYLEYRGLTF